VPLLIALYCQDGVILPQKGTPVGICNGVYATSSMDLRSGYISTIARVPLHLTYKLLGFNNQQGPPLSSLSGQNPNYRLSGSVCVSADGSWVRGYLGVGALLCMCGSGACLLCVHTSPIVSLHKPVSTLLKMSTTYIVV
jgi:hypothetical protein